MTKIRRVEIQFAESGQFLAGQLLSGEVIVELMEPKEFGDVQLQLKGTAKTCWTRHQGEL